MDAPQDLDARLHAIQAKIASLEQHLKILSKEEKELLFLRRRILFQRVPDDVLREIFLACLPTEHNPTMKTEDVPTLLTRISSRWRRVALSTPRLWASIHIVIPSRRYNRGKDIIVKRSEGISEWLLRRSGAVPLRISIYQDRGHFHGFVSCILDTLMACRGRWRCLDLSGTSDLLPLMEVDPSTVPLLETLCLSFEVMDKEEDYEYSSPYSILEPWYNSPILATNQLRRFSATSTSTTLANCTIDWSRLIHLSYSHYHPPRDGDAFYTFETLEEVLRQTPRLVSLIYKPSIGHHYPHNGQHQISLPLLEILDIEELSDGSPGWSILDLFEVPSLNNLTYLNKYTGKCPDDERLMTIPFLSLLTRTGGGIIRLKTNTLTTYSTTMAHLRLCPNLCNLELSLHGCRYSLDINPFVTVQESHVMGDNLLEALASDDTSQNPCPSLTYFLCSTHAKFSDHGIVEFIRRKQRGQGNINKLKAINIQLCRPLEMDIPALVSEHIDAGLEVVIEDANQKLPPRYPLDSGLANGQEDVFES